MKYSQDSEHLLNEQIESLVKIGSWILNLKTNELSWSDGVFRMLDYQPQEFLLSHEQGLEIIHPSDREEAIKLMEHTISTGKDYSVKKRLITKGGKIIHVKSTAKLIYDEAGDPSKLVGVFQDISDIIKSEQLAEEQNTLLNQLIKKLPSAFFLFNQNGEHLLWNEKLESYTGYNSDEIAKINAINFYEGKEKEKITEHIQKVLDEGYTELKAWLTTKSGDRIPLYFTASTINYKGRKCIFGTVADISRTLQLEENLKSATELAHLGAWNVNLVTSKVDWSDITRRIHEVSDSFIPTLEQGIDFFHADFKPLVQEALDKAIQTGEDFDFEAKIVTAKANERWIRSVGNAQMKNGKCVRLHGSFQDIDDRKKAQLKVQDILEEKEEILESIGDVFYAVDEEWKVTYWNKEAEIVFGKNRQDILSKDIWKVLGHNQAYYSQYTNAIKTKQQVQFEDYFPKLNKWFVISAYPSYHNGLSVFFKEITKIKKAEETLKIANDRFQLAALATKDAIWDWDIIANQTIRAGGGFERLFGYASEKVDNNLSLWSERVHSEDLDDVLISQKNVLQNKSKDFWTCEYRFKKKNGKYAHVIDRGYIVRNSEGEATRMIGATTNICDQKQYEESLMNINEQLRKQTKELTTSNDELEQFAYVASHDLQEPLRMVSGFLSQLEKKYGNQLDEKAHQYINYATDGAKRMRQIILDLLDFSKVGKDIEKEVDVDLNEIVAEVCLLNKKYIDEVDAKISYSNLPTLKAQPTLLIQLFQNLINNGIKFNREEVNPTIDIKAEELGNEWKFSVEDSGIGIEEKYFNQVFAIFQRLHNRDKFEGTGMGLAIVKKIIDHNNGKIWITSDGRKGTTFHFTLAKR